MTNQEKWFIEKRFSELLIKKVVEKVKKSFRSSSSSSSVEPKNSIIFVTREYFLKQTLI